MRQLRKQGFSLIELVLVCTILGMSAAIVFPMVGRSLRGGRLRTAAREVVMMGRYARSMALLEQTTVRLDFDRQAAAVSAVTDRERKTLKRRELKGVRVAALETDASTAFEQTAPAGEAVPLYRNNGLCTPYRLELVDEREQRLTIIVDRFGAARMEAL